MIQFMIFSVLAGGLLLVMYFYIMNVHMKKVFGTNGKD